MDWDRLRIFHTVAEKGSLTKAGGALNLSQSAISRQITTLEESLDVTLFRRHARGLVLTEQGEILYGAVKDIFTKLSSIEDQLNDARELPRGPITVTVADLVGLTWLVPRLAEFKIRYPEIQLTMILDDRILNLNMKEADVAIRLSKPTEHDLIHRHLGKLSFHICGSKKYFKKYGYPKNPADLKKHILIGLPEGVTEPYHNANWLFEIAGSNTQRDNNLLMMNSMYAIYRAVKEGAGLAVLPDYLIHADKVLEPVLTHLQRKPVDLYFIYAEDRRNSRRITVFRDFLMESLQAALAV
ncbi:MAG: LysR family transcriptional regulator [Alphaproteobacteria bacterium]